MSKTPIPTELGVGMPLVVGRLPTSLLAVHVKVVHGLFAGVGWLVETEEGNLVLVQGYTGLTAATVFLPFNSEIEDAIRLFGAQG
jgi:hypothetical protein